MFNDIVAQPGLSLSGAIQPDQPVYGIDVPVHLAAAIASRGNFTIPLLTARLLVISDGAGGQLHTAEQTITWLTAGRSVDLDFAWHTGHAPAGEYTATLTLLVEGRSEASATGAFSLAALPAVTGSLTPAHSNLPQGENLVVSLQVANAGNTPLAALPIRLLLAAPDGAVSASSAWTLDLAIDGVYTRVEELAANALRPGSYRLWLEGDLSGVSRLLAETLITVSDVTPPQLTVLAPLPGAMVTGPFELSALAEDGGSGVAGVEYQLDSGSWLPLPPQATVGAFGLAWTPVAAEAGEHHLLFRATDQAGNVSTSAPLPFTITLCEPLAALVGTLGYLPQPLVPGREIVFTYELVNGCPLALTDLNVRLQVSEATTGAMVYEATGNVTLPGQDRRGGEFRLAAPGLAAGKYRGILRVAAGTTERELALVELTVQADPAITAGVGDRRHLLVWLNSACGAEESDDDGDDADAEERARSHEAEGAEAGRGEECPPLALLEPILAGAVDYYYLARERSEFEAQLRNPLLTDLLILGDRLPLTGHYPDELRELVNSGVGLVVAGWLPAADQGLGASSEQALLGVVGGAGFGQDERLRLLTTDSPVTSAGELPSGVGYWRVTAAPDTQVAGRLGAAGSEGEGDGHAEDADEEGDRARVVGAPADSPAVVHEADNEADNDEDKDKDNDGEGDEDNDEDNDKDGDDRDGEDEAGPGAPAIVLHDYGLGRTVYYAFDYSRALTPERLAPLGGLLGDSLRHVHRPRPVGTGLAPLAVLPLYLAIPSSGEEFRFRLRAQLASGLRLYDYQNDLWQLGGDWQGDLAGAAGRPGRFAFSLLAPETGGDFALELTAASLAGGTEPAASLWSGSFPFTVPSDRGAMLAALADALAALRSGKAESARVGSIKGYLDNVRRRPGSCGRDLERNIQDLEQALAALLTINRPEVPALRLRLDELLRIEESRWYFHPEDGCGADADDDHDHDEHRSDVIGAEGETR